MRYLTLIIIIMLFGCKTQKLQLETVNQLDLKKYTGTWYEIARLPNSFEKGLKCTTANYSINDDGSIKVVNKGHKTDEPDKVKQSTGKALVPDKAEPGKLKVSFQWPFYGKYWVLKLDPEYKHVLVGTPSGKYLWLLSRNPDMDDREMLEYVEYAKSKGFNIQNLIYVAQDCNP
ncbi:lipocalin family protein [Saccharicrinis sp. FJH54]|uniref:lipocalin family protein n=1 Tax=Saccharicrinis sp. FJH54 TaxID=3344665 RepID=UPI0035D4DAAF